MRRKILSIVSVLLILSISASTAFAGNVHLSGSTSFSFGSLIADGTLAGLGNTDVNVILQGWGTGVATCTNKGGTSAPGQNPIQVSVQGIESIPATLTQNGTTPFHVETADPTPPTAKQAGCPNSNWQVTSFFVYWTSARITVEDTSGVVLLQQDFTCTTTTTSVSCTPTP
jgi:hypothetical protein